VSRLYLMQEAERDLLCMITNCWELDRSASTAPAHVLSELSAACKLHPAKSKRMYACVGQMAWQKYNIAPEDYEILFDQKYFCRRTRCLNTLKILLESINRLLFSHRLVWAERTYKDIITYKKLAHLSL
jgi:hypothetical protein